MLRTVQPTDTAQILIIENLTQSAPWTQEVFERCWQAGYLGWVLEQEKNVIGFIVISFQAGETHILNVCVHPNFQQLGHGRKLVEYVLAFAKSKGSGVVFLEVRRSNKNAIALYKKLDFVQIGERKNYYQMPGAEEDALVFAVDTGAFD